MHELSPRALAQPRLALGARVQRWKGRPGAVQLGVSDDELGEGLQ